MRIYEWVNQMGRLEVDEKKRQEFNVKFFLEDDEEEF